MQILKLQIIHLGLVFGCVFFLAVAVFLTGAPVTDMSKLADSPAGLILTGMAIVGTVTATTLQVMWPRLARSYFTGAGSDSPKGIAMEVASLYFKYVIVCGVITEGACYLSIVAYLLSQHAVALAVAIAGIVVLGLLFPTEYRAIRFARQVTGKAGPE